MNSNVALRNVLRIWLADGIGARLFYRLVDAFGSAEEAVEAGPGGWQTVDGLGPEKIKSLAGVTDRMIDDELARATGAGVEIVCRGQDGYPASLEQTFDPPPILYVRGRLESEDALSVAVVGSRRCTHYGLEQASRFGGILARAGFTVVSGGARGIDTAAHRAALDAGGRTAAVMGCGLSGIYPRENRDLFTRIAGEGAGALLSELPMNTRVRSGNFPKRNRIISGMSLGVLVVEAARRSGAMITARMAMEQNREVFAVPGRVDMPQSGGTHSLIRDGAHLAAEPNDIFGPLGEVGRQLGGDRDEPEDTAAAPAGIRMAGAEKKLYSVIEAEPLSLDEIVARSGMETGRVAATMTMLVLKGAVTQQPGNVFARKA